MKSITKIFGLLMYAFIVAALAWILYQLFFANEAKVEVEVPRHLEEFSIVYPESPIGLEPNLTAPSSRQLLINVYEPLLKFDADLNAQPALAMYWGLIDDKTWEFKLRSGVTFHDGSDLDVADISYSLERASLSEDSQLADFLTSIEDFEVIDDLTFRLKTFEPDPLLLQRVSLVLIAPSEGVNVENPVGTGPYKFVDENELVSNVDYWGTQAKFSKVNLIYEADKSKRTGLLLNGEADFLAFVPFDAVDTVQSKGFAMTFVPTLELQFLIFNTQSDLFESQESRRAVNFALDRRDLVNKLGAQAKAVNQFVSGGVFGSNPQIEESVFDLAAARSLAENSGIGGATVQIHLLKGLDVLGEYLRINLSKMGILPVISYLSFDDLIDSMKQGKADIYFLAFKSDLGDAMDFFDQLVLSDGEFNYLGYKNELVDQMIKAASTELSELRRRDLLQSAMDMIVNDDIFGVPLFEYEVGYAFNEKVEYEPRIDGLIYLNDLIIK